MQLQTKLCRFNFKVSCKLTYALVKWQACAVHMPSIGNHRSCFVIMDLTPESVDLTPLDTHTHTAADIKSLSVSHRHDAAASGYDSESRLKP